MASAFNYSPAAKVDFNVYQGAIPKFGEDPEAWKALQEFMLDVRDVDPKFNPQTLMTIPFGRTPVIPPPPPPPPIPPTIEGTVWTNPDTGTPFGGEGTGTGIGIGPGTGAGTKGTETGITGDEVGLGGSEVGSGISTTGEDEETGFIDPQGNVWGSQGEYNAYVEEEARRVAREEARQRELDRQREEKEAEDAAIAAEEEARVKEIEKQKQLDKIAKDIQNQKDQDAIAAEAERQLAALIAKQKSDDWLVKQRNALPWVDPDKLAVNEVEFNELMAAALEDQARIQEEADAETRRLAEQAALEAYRKRNDEEEKNAEMAALMQLQLLTELNLNQAGVGSAGLSGSPGDTGYAGDPYQNVVPIHFPIITESPSYSVDPEGKDPWYTSLKWW